ncbi:MAG: NAD kinase [Bacteroidales bacterium]|nr:NAD kinase [Bacteroidales bacterium]
MNIAIFGKNFSDDHLPFFKSMWDALLAHDVRLSMYHSYFEKLSLAMPLSDRISVFHSHIDLAPDTDILFSVGGDGTLLDTLPLVRESGIPVLGINTGRMGFLSSVSRQEVAQAIEAIFNQRYTLETRSLLMLEQPADLFGNLNYGLNELTIFRHEDASLIVIQVFVNEVFVNSYWADGLIIATPTGSTAYSLSAGGPIIVPEAPNFVITPIATHNLSVRPIVIPDNSNIRLKVTGRNKRYRLSMDSRTAVVEQQIDVVVRKAGFGMNLVKMEGKNFFGTIREKLMWGLDVRN